MKQLYFRSSAWVFILVGITANQSLGRIRISCDAFKSLKEMSVGISDIQAQMAPKHSVEAALGEIHESYTFFGFPVYDEGTRRLKEVCPNFQVMNPEDKEKFWINFWTQLAHYESSEKMKMGKGPHGALCGYLQLPCELDDRIAKVKPKNEFVSQCTGDIQSDNHRAGVNNFRCGMAILQTQLDNTNEIFPDKDKQKKVYWQPLRNPKQMYHKICNFQGCGNTPAVCQELLKKRENELR